ncbi:MAG: hypothetical protein Q8L14_27775 [Myxococcales bacterium]|nr:hypothetical protein [Myxococcales bacterium]
MSRFALVVIVGLTSGCATVKAGQPNLQPLAFEAGPPAPAVLEENHFSRDRSALGESALKEILAAPVFLEEHARIGVLPVAVRYEIDDVVPVEAAPSTLVDSLEASGLVDLATELSSEWPVDRGVAGLRELAARYRTEYLLLYRHRFVDATRPNPAAVSYLTLIAALFVPGTTVESAGVLEATLFDVKTGTILFTVNERVRGETSSTPLGVDRAEETQHRVLVNEGVKRLSDQVLLRMRRLVASRPVSSDGSVSAAVAR